MGHAKQASTLVIALMMLAAACGLGAKQRQAERIHASRERAIESATATAILRYEVTLDPESEELEGLPEAARTFAVTAAVGYDFGADAVRVVLGPTSAPVLEGLEGLEDLAELGGVDTAEAVVPDVGDEPDMLFHGDTVWVRRSNLRPTERRVWAKLDYARLPDSEPRINLNELDGSQIVLATMATLHPIVVFDLAVGALAGSIEERGSEDVHGVEATRFDSNVSIDRSISELDLPDDELESRLLMFRLLSLFDDVRPGRYWLDADGRLRGLEVELLQRESRRQEHGLTVSLEITGYGDAVEVPLPGAEETVTFERHGRLVRTVAPDEG